MSTSRTVLALVALGGCLTIAACGGPATPAPTPTERPLMAFDFEPVCRRGTVEDATAYEPTPGQVHPVLVFKRDTTEDNTYYEMTPSLLELPVPWMVEYGSDYTRVELVACLTRTGGDLVGVCDYEGDEGEETYLLNTYNSTYEVMLYAAQSGQPVGTMTIEATVDDCPMFHMFSDPEEDYYALPPSGILQSALQPYVEP